MPQCVSANLQDSRARTPAFQSGFLSILCATTLRHTSRALNTPLHCLAQGTRAPRGVLLSPRWLALLSGPPCSCPFHSSLTLVLPEPFRAPQLEAPLV